MNRLRNFRKKAEPGQEAMVELLHTTRSLLSMAELGHRAQPEEYIERIKTSSPCWQSLTTSRKRFP